MDRRPPHARARAGHCRRGARPRSRSALAARPQPLRNGRIHRLHHRAVDDLPHRKASAAPQEDSMKIAVLFGQFEDYEEQPGADLEAAKPKRKRKKKKTDVEAITDSRRELGHEATTFAIDGRPQTLARLARADAEL